MVVIPDLLTFYCDLVCVCVWACFAPAGNVNMAHSHKRARLRSAVLGVND